MSETAGLQSELFVRWRDKLSYRLTRATLVFGAPFVVYTSIVENIQTSLFLFLLYLLLLGVH
ncbi:MAG: hypothetical protein ACI9FB_004585, partial [Candidatus Azotimanducaceae bacterium]